MVAGADRTSELGHRASLDKDGGGGYSRSGYNLLTYYV
jgi:hypothetical protein